MTYQTTYSNHEVRETARELVIAYTTYICRKIEEGNQLYSTTDIDTSVDSYELLYKLVLGDILGVKHPKRLRSGYSGALIKDVTLFMKTEVKRMDREHIVSQHPYSKAVYEVCMFVFCKYREGNSSGL